MNWYSCLLIFLTTIFFYLEPAAQTSLNITLLDNWKQDSLVANSSKVRYNDCFGFTWKGREYAVAGSTEGTHIFEISAGNTFIPRGFVKGRFSDMSVIHRDYATYQHYLYAVCDEGVSDLQVIDYQYLPDSVHVAVENTTQFGRVHNVFIDTIQAKLYSCIHRSTVNTQVIEAPMKVFSLADPLNPVEMWSGPGDVNEVHDCYVRNGRAILNCGYDGMRVYDFTNASSPLYLDSKQFYQDQGYNHQGWLSPDGKTYVFADESNGMRVKKCAFNGTQINIQQYFGTNYENGSVPHNIMCTDTFAFVAYYNEGLRIFDLRTAPPSEIAHYDTYPDNAAYKLNGNWGIYSLLPSQRLVASDRQYGLFLFDFNRGAFRVPANEDAAQFYPNPVSAGDPLMVQMPTGVTVFHWTLTDQTGREIQQDEQSDATYFHLGTGYSAGMYILKLVYTKNDGEFTETKRILIE